MIAAQWCIAKKKIPREIVAAENIVLHYRQRRKQGERLSMRKEGRRSLKN